MFLFVETCKKRGAFMAMDNHLLNTIAAMDDPWEIFLFFEEIFTPRELADLSLRWKLMMDLHRGMTQRKIAEKYGISLCKITRGSKILKKDNSVTLKILSGDGFDNKK